MTTTSIEWTDKSWNPTRGCTIISPGCTNCYAMKQAHRFHGKSQPYEGLTVLTSQGPKWTGKIHLSEDKLDDPLHWNKPSRIFVNSMSDLFHEDVPFEYIDKVFAVMALTPWHTYQSLTKRPNRMHEYLQEYPSTIPGYVEFKGAMATVFSAMVGRLKDTPAAILNRAAKWQDDHCPSWEGDGFIRAWPLPNVWLGVSVENQQYADERIPLLLQTPAAVRWVSYEPALGPVDFWKYLFVGPEGGVDYAYSRRGMLNWVVCGGESGPGARPFRTEWARDVIAQCKSAGVPVFVKQLGANVIQDGEHRVKKDRKGGDMDEWPHDLRVREYPGGVPHEG